MGPLARPARVFVIVLDSVGIGETPDACIYGDEGSNTLSNIAKAVGGLNLPNMMGLGLGRIPGVSGVSGARAPGEDISGAFGRMLPASPGKDTMGGHWELMGLLLDRPFRIYPDGFPDEVISAFEERIGRRVLGNVAASGTEIIARLGVEHMKTGMPIVYTSADSVFQIAAHEAVIPVDELYRICEVARAMLVGEHMVGRVIARPFEGEGGAFRRTGRRRDFALEPPAPTVLDNLAEAGVAVTAIGKIQDIFSGRGISWAIHTSSNAEASEAMLDQIRAGGEGLVFANLVDFDMLFGHRNDPAGYARALVQFDAALGQMLPQLRERDLMMITADHGCDPTTPGTDHSREYVPLLVAGPGVRRGTDVGLRNTLADLGATVAEAFEVRRAPAGASFLNLVWNC